MNKPFSLLLLIVSQALAQPSVYLDRHNRMKLARGEDPDALSTVVLENQIEENQNEFKAVLEDDMGTHCASYTATGDSCEYIPATKRTTHIEKELVKEQCAKECVDMHKDTYMPYCLNGHLDKQCVDWGCCVDCDQDTICLDGLAKKSECFHSHTA